MMINQVQYLYKYAIPISVALVEPGVHGEEGHSSLPPGAPLSHEEEVFSVKSRLKSRVEHTSRPITQGSNQWVIQYRADKGHKQARGHMRLARETKE